MGIRCRLWVAAGAAVPRRLREHRQSDMLEKVGCEVGRRRIGRHLCNRDRLGVIARCGNILGFESHRSDRCVSIEGRFVGTGQMILAMKGWIHGC